MTVRVLITGAARGIGAATALAFAREGARVLVADLNRPHATAEAAGAVGAADVQAHECDVSDAGAVFSLRDAVKEIWGGLDVLVHCAGIIHEAPLLETPIADFDRVIAVNLRGSFLIGQAAVGLMTPDATNPPRVRGRRRGG